MRSVRGLALVLAPRTSAASRRALKGGRPKHVNGLPIKQTTLVVNVRLDLRTFDAYCRVALHEDLPLRTVLRDILALHVPFEYL